MEMPDIYEIQDFLSSLDSVGVPRIMVRFGVNFKDASKIMDFITQKGLVGERVDGFNYKVERDKLIYRVIKKSEVPAIAEALTYEMVRVMKAIEVSGADTIETIKAAGAGSETDAAVDTLVDLKIICKKGEKYFSRVEMGMTNCFDKVMLVKHRAMVLNRDDMENMVKTFLKYAKVDEDI